MSTHFFPGTATRTAPGTGTDPQLAVTAALAGAAVVRDMYGTDLGRVDKGAGDFATSADLAAESAVLAVLRAARPDDGVTGEESGRSGADRAERRWLVDPLCGTLNYAVGDLLVGVNVALRAGGRTTAAATADPFGGEVYWTDGERTYVRRPPRNFPAGSGAAPRDAASDEIAVPSAASRLVDVNLDPPFPHAPSIRAVKMLGDAGFGARFRPRVVSTTLAVAWVAAGRRAAYVTDGEDLRGSVHFAAGIALCRAAGCVVTGIDGRALDAPGAGGLIAAADAETHAALLEALAGGGS
jgi:myo-inositol-1(or 4)-monophosphatase